MAKSAGNLTRTACGICAAAMMIGSATMTAHAQVTVDNQSSGLIVTGYANRSGYTSARNRGRVDRDPYAAFAITTRHGLAQENPTLDGGFVSVVHADQAPFLKIHDRAEAQSLKTPNVGVSMDSAFLLHDTSNLRSPSTRGYSQAHFAYYDPYRARIVTRTNTTAGSAVATGSRRLRDSGRVEFINPYSRVRYSSPYPRYGSPVFYTFSPGYYWGRTGWRYDGCWSRFESFHPRFNLYPGTCWRQYQSCNRDWYGNGNVIHFSSNCGLVIRFGF